MRTHYQSGGLSVDLYHARERDYRNVTEGDVKFFLKQARHTGGPILDLGAGTGRVSLPLARQGYEVVGLDLSPHMLAVARAKATPELKIRFVRGNMAAFELRRKFRLIVIPFRAFQHLSTPAEQRSCLRCVRRHLSRGGRFVLDLFDPRLDLCQPIASSSRVERERVRHPVTGNWVSISVQDRTNDPLTQTFRETWVYVERDSRGRIVRESKDQLSLRWTYRWEMRYLLELTGFKVLECFGDYRGGPPRYGAEQIWLAE